MVKSILSLSLLIVVLAGCGGSPDQALCQGCGHSGDGGIRIPSCRWPMVLDNETDTCVEPPQPPPLVMWECCMSDTATVTGPGVIGNTPLARCYTFPDVTRASDNSLNCGDGLFAAEGCSDC